MKVQGPKKMMTTAMWEPQVERALHLSSADCFLRDTRIMVYEISKITKLPKCDGTAVGCHNHTYNVGVCAGKFQYRVDITEVVINLIGSTKGELYHQNHLDNGV